MFSNTMYQEEVKVCNSDIQLMSKNMKKKTKQKHDRNRLWWRTTKKQNTKKKEYQNTNYLNIIQQLQQHASFYFIRRNYSRE